MKSESGYSKKNGIRSGNIQGSQNFKIPGSPSGRYYSDFGSPKINLTSPNKKKTINVNQKHFQYTNINEYQGKSFIVLFTGYLQNF